MIVNSRIWFLAILITVAACSNKTVTPIVPRPVTIERSANDGLTDDYVRFVELARKFLRQGEFELAAAYYEVAHLRRISGISTYGTWIELAEAKCRNGKPTEAFPILVDYDMALRLDFGKETCGGEYNSATRSPPNPNMSMKVFARHCIPEIAMRVTEKTSEDEKREHESHYLELAAESARLARRCEILSSTN